MKIINTVYFTDLFSTEQNLSIINTLYCDVEIALLIIVMMRLTLRPLLPC